MSETVKLVVVIDAQLGTEPGDVHEWIEELAEELRWGLCDKVQVGVDDYFEVTVWLRVRGGLSPEEYGRMFKSRLNSEAWCLVEGVVTAETVER
jgi:hypothetical protein